MHFRVYILVLVLTMALVGVALARRLPRRAAPQPAPPKPLCDRKCRSTYGISTSVYGRHIDAHVVEAPESLELSVKGSDFNVHCLFDTSHASWHPRNAWIPVCLDCHSCLSEAKKHIRGLQLYRGDHGIKVSADPGAFLPWVTVAAPRKTCEC
jgi:hypothetical protein